MNNILWYFYSSLLQFLLNFINLTPNRGRIPSCKGLTKFLSFFLNYRIINLIKLRNEHINLFKRTYSIQNFTSWRACIIMHPRPSGMHIAIDSWLLILSFQLKFFVCRHVSIWGFQNPVCLSVNMETQKFEFRLKKMKWNFDLCWRAKITIALSISVIL